MGNIIDWTETRTMETGRDHWANLTDRLEATQLRLLEAERAAMAKSLTREYNHYPVLNLEPAITTLPSTDFI